MATSNIAVTEGSGKYIATHSVTEDAVTKQIQRVVLDNNAGTDIGTAANPLQVSLANTAANSVAVKVDGSAATQPVSAVSLPLPTGAATAAKQPALGTAGTPSADVISVQGITSMTPLKTDASATTQPVSAISLPLPTGASTETTLASVKTAAELIDDSVYTSGSGTVAKGLLVLGGNGTTPKAINVDTNGTLQIQSNNANLATQTTVASIDGKITACNTGAVTVSAALPAGTNAIGKLAANSGVDIGDVDVLSIAAGTNTIGAVNVKPATAGGLTTYRLLSAATTNGNNIKASAGQVFGWYISNATTSAKFVKLYNKATAPTVGTDTPVMTLSIPASGAANVEFTNGIAFGTGIGIGITGAVADVDTTAVAANDVVVNLLYA